MTRTKGEDNAINRTLKAWGMGTLDDPGTLAQMAYLVDSHDHFTKLLKACDPELRRDMYDALSPHLRFKAKALEDYVIAAKQYAEKAQLEVMDEAGKLHPFKVPEIAIEVPQFELWVVCLKCDKEAFFYAEREADAIFDMRKSGWAYDETGHKGHLCPECLDALD